ncbi:MAG: ornithine cyclodeaminase [Pseudomonadota bacterium]
MVVSLTAQDIRKVATWPLLVEALRNAHRRPPADIGDTFVHSGPNTMLVRSAYVDGVAAGVKAATVVPANTRRTPALPSIHAQVMLFDADTGELTALADGTEITGWKTAADSALGCDCLARKDAKTLLMVGAGAMARPLIEAHLSVRPGIEQILLWNRTRGKADELSTDLAHLNCTITVVEEMDQAAGQADIISCATMSAQPVLHGANLSPGTHVDLVGAFKADMREADDVVLQRGSIYVDSFATTIDHIGELMIPIASGAISRDDVLGDLHALVSGEAGRRTDDEITIFKNGGGAHLDVMITAALVDAHMKSGATG